MKKLTALILAAMVAVSFSSCKGKDKNAEETKPAQANASEEGGMYYGSLEAGSETKVIPSGKGKIIEANYEVGDYVQQGALLYRLDDNGLGDTIKTTQNSIAKSKLSLQTARENVSNLKVYAPASGILHDFDIKTGDRVNSSKIGYICDENSVVALVPFNEAQKSKISVGDRAKISGVDFMSSVEGTVKRIYDARESSSVGTALYNVEISIKNSGGLSEGYLVNAEITNVNGSFSSPEYGKIKMNDAVNIISRGSGYAKNVYAKDGQYVKKGALLLETESTQTETALKRAELDLADLNIKLASYEADYKDLFVYAPTSGVITDKAKKLNDNIISGSESVMTISDISTLNAMITVPADKLKTLKEGQEISLIVSGSGEELKGTVISTDSDDETVTVTYNNASGAVASGTVVGIKL